MLKHPSGPEEIRDEDGLYRRIHPSWIKDKGISSAAFKQSSLDLSVDIARLTTPDKVLSSHQNYGIGIVTAGFFRHLKLVIYHAPEPCNYAHAIVLGKITQSMAKKISLSAKPLRYREVFPPALPQSQ